MPNISQETMEAALKYFHGLNFQTKVAALWESYLTGRIFASKGIQSPTVNDANDVVGRLFTVEETTADGRLRPFRYKWADSEASGRKTVWNQTTRKAQNLASSLFNNADIRDGMIADPETVLISNSPELPLQEALTALLVRDYTFPLEANWNDAHSVVLNMLGMTLSEYNSITDRNMSLGTPLLDTTPWTFSALPDDLLPTPSVVIQTQPSTSLTQDNNSQQELVIEERTERMLRRAVAIYPFILLVGPPGTGKGTLIKWLTEQVQSDPASFNFPPGFDPNPLWRTPDESWSAFDLIGGLAPDEKGSLKWSPGALLNAIQADRWLVLDETNRADMDKIMGPLMTWLSGQAVEIGRDSAHQGNPITIDWGKLCQSTKHENEFTAGTSWRMFGTYNPADAQKVFKFGLALSRRFVVIPIPSLEPENFESLLARKYPMIDQDISDSVTGLYSAHYTDQLTQLGPAIFLRIVEYLNADATATDEELLSEAYIMNFGKYIAAYDEGTLEALGRRIMDEGAITEDGWAWIKSHRNTLG